MLFLIRFQFVYGSGTFFRPVLKTIFSNLTRFLEYLGEPKDNQLSGKFPTLTLKTRDDPSEHNGLVKYPACKVFTV